MIHGVETKPYLGDSIQRRRGIDAPREFGAVQPQIFSLDNVVSRIFTIAKRIVIDTRNLERAIGMVSNSRREKAWDRGIRPPVFIREKAVFPHALRGRKRIQSGSFYDEAIQEKGSIRGVIRIEIDDIPRETQAVSRRLIGDEIEVIISGFGAGGANAVPFG